MTLIQDTNISNLEPIIAPEEVAFWPPQPGWYVVIVLLLILVVYLVYKKIEYKKKNAYRKRALVELEHLKANTNGSELLTKLSILLKATALKGFPRNQVASLTGNDWIVFLETTEPHTKFPDTLRNMFIDASFKESNDSNLENTDWNQLFSICKNWIRKHKVKN